MSTTAHTLSPEDQRFGLADWRPDRASFRHWRLIAGAAAVTIALVWLSFPTSLSQRDIEVHLTTFAFRV